MFNIFVSGFCFAMVVINVSLMVVTDGKFDGSAGTLINSVFCLLNLWLGIILYRRKN